MKFNTIDHKAKDDALKFSVNALRQAYPHLVAVSETSNPLVTAAKNVRIELARAFPGVKFSVTTSRFAGGDSLRVKWTDGPTVPQVDAISGRYQAGHFDGMEDLYTYRKDQSWPVAFGDAKYVQSTRDYSPALVQIAIDYLWDRYRPEAPKITVEDYFEGRAWSIVAVKGACPGDANAQSQIHRFAYKYDCISQSLLDGYPY